jgi:Homeodomain-like domain
LNAALAAVAARCRGRPTKYEPDFPLVVVELGRKGMSQIEIADVLDVDRSTIHRWRAKHPEFDEGMIDAIDRAQAYWERFHRNNALAGRELGSAFIFMMKNRFRDPDLGYRDRHEVKHEGTGFAAFLAAIEAGKVPLPPNPHGEPNDDEGTAQ